LTPCSLFSPSHRHLSATRRGVSKEQLERGGAAYLSGAQGVLHDPQLPQGADPHPTPGTGWCWWDGRSEARNSLGIFRDVSLLMILKLGRFAT